MTSGKHKDTIGFFSNFIAKQWKLSQCIRMLSLLLFFFSFESSAQIDCKNVAQDIGVDHHYLSVSYMGGGAAFFDYDNDGDEDLWIVGGLNQDVLYENNGNGTFTEIGTEAGLSLTNNHVTSGVITGDLDNDGYRDVVVLPHIGFHPLLFKNNGNGTFTEISESAGLNIYEGQCHAATIGDVNQDGFLDVYFAFYIQNINNIYGAGGAVVGFDHDCFKNRLFINNGDWTFEEKATEYGVANQGCALASTFTDYDLDGDADLLVANDFGEWVTPNALYENVEIGQAFENKSQATGMDVGLYGMGIATGDFDQDEDLDYYITNLGRNVFLKNNGDNTFVDFTTETGTEDTYAGNEGLLSTSWGTAMIDVDNDTDLDLFVCNGYVPASLFIETNELNENRLFINNGTSFEEKALDSNLDDTGRGRGFAYSDFDNDGDLDFVVVNVNQHTSGDEVQDVLFYENENGNDQNWLKIKLEGIASNRDAYGAYLKITVGDKTWAHDYNGGFGTHASQHSSIAHFGLGNATQIDELEVNWPGGQTMNFENLDANQFMTISEDGQIVITEVKELGKEKITISAQPNPFKENTRIEFSLPKSTYVSFDVVDAIGKVIGEKESAWYPAGTHTVDDLILNKKYSGLVFLRLKTSLQTVTLKLVQYN